MLYAHGVRGLRAGANVNRFRQEQPPVVVEGQQDSTSLVARIIAELQGNPEAQRPLLRALLTNEFLGMPARLDRIEKDIAELKADVVQIKADVTQLKADVSGLKADVSGLKTDVAHLKGSDLEHRLHRRIRALASRALDLRRPRVVQSPVQETEAGFADRVEDALDGGRITGLQEVRIEATDFVMHAQRRSSRAPVWVAVEASNRVHAGDIERAQATADALRAVFEVDAVAVVAGYGIDPLDAERAKAARVRYLEVPPAPPS